MLIFFLLIALFSVVGTQVVRACTLNDGACEELWDRSLDSKINCGSGFEGRRAY